jgi:3'(2'), 5'-bisphosphate nucleotidase
MIFDDKIFQRIFSAAREAGAAILSVFQATGDDVDYKNDGSPVTVADKLSHEIISTRLRQYFPAIHVLSEEAMSIPYEERKRWKQFWLVDPLDGTKEFIKKTGEFTVNIALIDNGLPVLGIIHAPVLNVTYFAYNGKSNRLNGSSKIDSVTISGRNVTENNFTVVASRDHAGPQVKSLLKRLPGATTKSIGSSLKFCLVAEGAVDLYYRDGPTMEWDTAAGQAIVEAAGGAVLTEDGVPLRYNKELLKNLSFVTIGDKSFNWKRWIG